MVYLLRKRGAWWQDRFHDIGARITAPREIVIAVLQETDDHMSASDVYIRAHKINPSIGLTTVYRTLDMLTQLGIVQKFDFGDGKARFELVNNPGGKKHHHHLICMNCKTIVDYTEFLDEELEFINKTQEKLSKKYNFKITDHAISFYGYCDQCR
ncbi:MAG: transcriptional repressor [Spirochaetes bacterium]|nr:transcriptional repressor [Spirochaetota bacterium]